MKKIGIFLALLWVLGASPASALCPIEGWVDEKADSTRYFVKMGGMILRGIHGIVESPVELFYHPYDELRHRPQYGLGLLKGLGLGIFWTIDKAARGAWDIGTAIIPDYNGEPPDHDDFAKEEVK